MMCKWCTEETFLLPIPAHLSHSGKKYMKEVPIDKCIAPIVKALNDADIETIASCCGHDKGHGTIDLVDGRRIMIIKAEYFEENKDG